MSFYSQNGAFFKDKSNEGRAESHEPVFTIFMVDQFMKKKEDADERKKTEEEQRKMAQQGHWVLANAQLTDAKPK